MARSPAPSRSVLTLGAPPDGRGAVLSAAERTPCFGTLDLDAERAVRSAWAEALAPRGLVVPGEDAALGAAERRIGRQIAGLLEGPGMRQIATRLAQLDAAARAAKRPLDLLLDLQSPGSRALPWELLELLPTTEPLGGCRVARLVEGGSLGVAPAPGLEVLIWSPTPDDPDCATVLAGLEQTLAGLPGLGRARASDPPAACRVVHVVCHGGARSGARGEPVLELGPSRHLDAATLGRVLQPLIAGAALVVLDVCGADGEEEPAALPAWRVVDAGAATCLAPRSTLDVEASVAMSAALYGALATGETFQRAVQAGRGAMAALGLPDPSARWWTLTLVVADPAVLDLAPAQPRPREIPGLEQVSPATATLLLRASEMASAQGFFGLEHVALALSRLPDPPPLLALVQPQLASFASKAAGFHPTGLPGSPATPRILTLLERLPAGCDLEGLVRALALSRPLQREAPGLSGLLGEAALRTLTLSDEAQAARGKIEWPVIPHRRGLRLEVLGGPEDGLVCTLENERPLLGRWDPEGAQPEVAVLFAEAGATDPGVSRRHLRWKGGAEIEALAPTALRRSGALQPVGASTLLRFGDVLELGQATRLEVVGVPT